MGDVTLPSETEASGYFVAIIAWMLSEGGCRALSHSSLKRAAGLGVGGRQILPIKFALLKFSFSCFILQANILFPAFHTVDKPELLSPFPFHYSY